MPIDLFFCLEIIELLFYNITIKLIERKNPMDDYKQMITEMLNKIQSEAMLKRIYNFICRLYLKGGK